MTLRAQRAALAAALVVLLLVLVALAAPLLTALAGQDPNTYHPDLVDSAAGGVPIGPFGGISADHWLGVEPQTGRDLFARIVYGARVSLGVALTVLGEGIRTALDPRAASRLRVGTKQTRVGTKRTEEDAA